VFFFRYCYTASFLSSLPAFLIFMSEAKLSHYSQWRRKREEELDPAHSWSRHKMGVSGQRHAPAALYARGKDPRYPLNRKLGEPQSWSDTEARGKILCLCRGLNPGRPLCCQTLYWLSYPAPILTSKTITKYC
jgi:hypothetical protein